MNKKDFLYVLSIILIYLTILILNHPQIFTYRFNENLLERYLRSQDITHEVVGRTFLSDSEIHEAAGYLYATGEDPTTFNFQHPPFIKYIYGFATVTFGNPYIVQILFGIGLLTGTYILGRKLYASPIISLVASLFLAVDPLLIDLSQNLLLDLGQSTLVIFYIISLVWYSKKWFLQGILLGLLSSTKFWGGTTLFIVVLMLSYLFIKKKINYKLMAYHFVTAIVVFSLMYIKTFIIHNGAFNIIFFELKTLKYWLNHSVSSIFGASFLLFVSGYVHSWWGDKETIRVPVWTILWPLTLFATTYTGVKQLIQKKVTMQLFISFIPILYLCYLGVQAPFTRYFIVILPFLYLSTTALICKKMKLAT